MNKTFGNYKLIAEIGKGSFGTVYKALNLNDNKVYALKLEDTNSDVPQLENEYIVYTKLDYITIPNIYYFGKQDKSYYLTMSLLGPSLSTILSKTKTFSLKTVCMIGISMVKTIEHIHSKKYIYRDMKPENILTNGKKLFLVDFGMCKRYMVNGKHIKFIDGKILTGTARYASISTHEGYEQSRRDDMEGLMYTLIYMLRGKLPWMGIPAPTRKEKYAKIGDVKRNTTSAKLCQDLEGSKYLVKILDYVKKIKFEEKPDYEYVISVFKNILDHYGLKNDGMYDWRKDESEQENGSDKSETEDKSTPWTSIKSFFKNF